MQKSGNLLLIDYNLLIKEKVSLDSWFILYCLTNNKRDLLLSYTEECGKINTIHFKSLESKGYIILLTKDSITLDSIRLTNEGKNIIIGSENRDNEIFNRCFQELVNTYPKKVPSDNGSMRRLHGDISRCKKLYRKILQTTDSINEELHKSILIAIDKMINEYTQGRRLPFLQNLSTFLHQQNFLQYIGIEEFEEVKKDKGDDI